MAFEVNGHTYYTTEGEEKQHLAPFDTQFGNNYFRSRNEARWDIIFDRLDIARIYEHEPIRLPSGNGYLPDFYIRDTGYLVDVKMYGLNDSSMKFGNIQEALDVFNNPANKGMTLDGYEDLPINGLLVTPTKMYLNYPVGEYAEYHARNKMMEEDIYNFILTIMGVSEEDTRFDEWSRNNPNFEHIKRAVMAGIQARFEHNETPSPVGYRNEASDNELIEWYGSKTIGQHSGHYVWDYFEKHQLRPLLELVR